MAQTAPTRLQEVSAAETELAAAPVNRVDRFNGDLLMTLLRTLSQKTVVALASLVDLALIASVFVLLLIIIGEPTTAQLVGVAGYAVFICACLALLVRRRG